MTMADVEHSIGMTPEPPRPVDRACYQSLFSAVGGPVAVVTTAEQDRPWGTTVSAFCSLSLDPPLVLVSLDDRSDLLAAVRRTGRFAVNVLRRDQSDVAAAFARKGVDKFTGVAWQSERDLPRLSACTAWMAARVERLVSAGDHTILIGLIVDGEAVGGDPLLYHDRRFRTLGNLAIAGDASSA